MHYTYFREIDQPGRDFNETHTHKHTFTHTHIHTHTHRMNSSFLKEEKEAEV
jgi:hypothetical protein